MQPNYIRRAIAAPPNDPFWTARPALGAPEDSGPRVWDQFTIGQIRRSSSPTSTRAWITRTPTWPRTCGATRAKSPATAADDDNNGYVDDVFGIDVINANESPGGPEDPMDDQGHGTHVAGTIAGVGNNGAGITGVTWNSKILACKFIGSNGEGTDADAIGCFDYIVALKRRGVNIRVSNNSWGVRRDGPAPVSAIGDRHGRRSRAS